VLEVRCADLGIPCRGKVRGRTEQEVVEGVAEHARSKHGVPELNATLVDYALSRARGSEEREGEE
jgi:predicted small metal-binding protein